MVERLVRIQEVRGSIPLISTKNKSTEKVLLFLAEKKIRGIEQPVKKTSQCDVFRAPRS